MSDKQNRKPKVKVPPVVLTAEQIAANKAALELRNAELKAERDRVEQYGKDVQKMSHSQLRAELKKTIRKEHAGRPPEPQAGLTIALASIFLTVLDNTRTAMDVKLRRDQYNPTAKKTMNPGW
jgi:hypothetical protein